MLHQIRRDLDALPSWPVIRVAYFIWKDPWMVAGGDTFISVMLEKCGFENVFKGRTRYPEVSHADLHESGCQLVLLSSEPFPFKEVHKKEFPTLPVQLVDGEMFSWYGSHLLQSAAYFRQLRGQILTNII